MRDRAAWKSAAATFISRSPPPPPSPPSDVRLLMAHIAASLHNAAMSAPLYPLLSSDTAAKSTSSSSGSVAA